MLLLKTHALVWLATDLSQLTDAANSAIRFHSTERHLSSVSALEISLLTQCGKLKWGRNPLSRFERALEHHCVNEVPVDCGIAWKSGQFPPIHRDPFIIATAQAHGMTILTKNRTIPTYPQGKAVWE
jgi:PIN domain nuclease of toxin-antitoxin system